MKLLIKLLLGVLLIGLLGAIVGANFHRDPSFVQFKWKLQDEVPIEVKLEPASRQKMIPTVEAPGEVEADVEVEVSAQVVGRIVKLPVREGDPVKKGDLLVQIEPADFEADVRAAEARVLRLRAAIDLAEQDVQKSRRDLERTKQLFESRATSSGELADMETATTKNVARLAMNRAELIEAEATRAKAKENLAHTTIRSTIDGVVSRLVAEEGEVVVVGTMNNAGTIIMVVSDLNTRVVRARVDESDIPRVHPGQKVLIHLQYNEDLPLTGRVLRITPKGIKPGSGVLGTAGVGSGSSNEVATYETLIAIDNPPPEVHLQMSANVDIQVDERDQVLTIPSQAVLHRRRKDLPLRMAADLDQLAGSAPGATKDPAKQYYQTVFVNVAGKAECRIVKTGVSDEHRVEILSGLREGEQVVTGPYRVFDKLRDGKPVKEITEKDKGKE